MRKSTRPIGVSAMVLIGAFAPLMDAAEPASQPATANTVQAGTQEEGQWSAAVNGLEARVVIKQGSVNNGTLILIPCLELRNVSNVGNPMKFAWDISKTTIRVLDAEKQPLPPPAMMAYDGGGFQKFDLLLPASSTISFPITSSGAGIPADQAGLIDLGLVNVFLFKRDGKDYFFDMVIDAPGDYQPNADGTYDWHGKIQLPPVKVPLRIPALDGKAAEKAIAQWGPMLLSKNANESDEAGRQLSLIDDDRVIPWYVKAVAADDYEMKFAALDRLGRLKGDEALAGLKIGMATQGKDIGNCTTAEVAAQCAENIRVKAAHALARSPHPDAQRLLMTMAEDPAKSVRLTAMQSCAAMNTPEGWAIVSKATQDADEVVRGEAARLLKDHERIK